MTFDSDCRFLHDFRGLSAILALLGVASQLGRGEEYEEAICSAMWIVGMVDNDNWNEIWNKRRGEGKTHSPLVVTAIESEQTRSSECVSHVFVNIML